MTNFTRAVFRGQTIYRILMDRIVEKHCRGLKGEVLDLAGGGNPSYYRVLPKNIHLIRTNVKTGGEIDKIVDFNRTLPFTDEAFDGVLFFNALYIVEDRNMLWREIKRILKPGGKAFIASPFIANEMPEPHDYCRLTREGIMKEIISTGFEHVEIQRFGERFTAAAYLLHPLFFFKFIRFIVYSAALCLDKCIPRKLREHYPTPLGYFCMVEK